ncbi:putative hydrolase of the HAD superfamily [Extensimonas vulgaris]|uniref:Putative hydrolase of the HAD superfamily n=2 Tax=Extensimonas vulgaris TaxID=1031594 RepID=A0A369ATE7_9BURK|nr:putative hydrolase of the HAD superfamily [Extensimonas vulgaris]TWI40433.1 putative hydrolase of the HAD superfamily [Extensimonas vulgaris]
MSAMLDPSRIRAVSLDLDDTLWPVAPTIARAEAALRDWLAQHAPATAALHARPAAAQALRAQVEQDRPDLRHDLGGLRRETLRRAFLAAGDDPALAEPAFEVFYLARQRVQLYADAHAALEFLSARFALVAVSNGNADVHRTGVGRHFRAAIAAGAVGVAKPDARIFHAAAQALDVPPAAELHVGDDATLDALGAVRAGMQAVWLNRSGAPWPHGPEHAPHASVPDLTALCRLLAGVPVAAPALHGVSS